MRLIRVGLSLLLFGVMPAQAKPVERIFTLMESGKYDEAELGLRRQLSDAVSEDTPGISLALAFVLLKQGRHAEARMIVNSLDPGSAAAEDGKFLIQTYSGIATPAPAPRTVARPPASDDLGPPVRVRLAQGQRLTLGRDKFVFSGRRIRKNGKFVPSPCEISPETPYKGRTYRGKLEILASRGRLVLLNTLPMEEYLYGVVRSEIPPDWNVEAIKAQAIASRTFAMSRMRANGAEGLTADVSHQVYLGKSAEDARVTAAVRATQGKVLTFQGDLIEAVFHAESGGTTESAADLWGKARPYLVARTDPYVGESPRAVWTAEFGEKEIFKALDRNARSRIGGVKHVEILEKSESGRAKKLLLTGNRGQAEVLAGKFRLSLGPDKLRSLLWTDVEYRARKFTVKGRGWGHGVGLPQWSARHAAEQGLGAEEILTFYYPGTEIVMKY